jgi:hypothetical protein
MMSNIGKAVFRSGLTLTALVALCGAAQAADIPHSINAPPSGPGTEATPRAQERGWRTVPGWDASVQIGSGFTDTYGCGLGARGGYTFPIGVYVGGVVSHYFGNSVTTNTGSESAHATFVGGEGGFKFFPAREWEIRPYVFMGPAFIKEVQGNPFFSESRTRFGVQPGALTAYHFGGAFLSAEARWYVTPSPTGFTLMGGAGLGF